MSAQAVSRESIDELRDRNHETVRKYMRTEIEHRLDRYRLFAPDGCGMLWFTDIGEPIVTRGRDKLKAHGEVSVRVLPDWQWTEVRIYSTQDPNRFWVECGGRGRILFPGYPEGVYTNRFVHAFLLDDGLIVEAREIANPLEHMRALGIETPVIKRDWIPK